jgi:cyclase
MIPRVIPCLLLNNSGLVKTIKFKNETYIGDPLNAVRIFNEKEVDELVFLDITATVENRKINKGFISKIAGECFMPLSYGGGIKTIEEIREIFGLGVEKVIINSHAVEHPEFVEKAANVFGSQSIVISIDVKKKMFGEYEVVTKRGKQKTKLDPVTFAIEMEKRGAGELMLNSTDRDGTMNGYDIDLLTAVTRAVKIPVIACGGAGRVEDLVNAVNNGGASAVAAGSLFVFYGPLRAVLINYPSREQLLQVFE